MNGKIILGNHSVSDSASHQFDNADKILINFSSNFFEANGYVFYNDDQDRCVPNDIKESNAYLFVGNPNNYLHIYCLYFSGYSPCFLNICFNLFLSNRHEF
jgi:hypothetical protein